MLEAAEAAVSGAQKAHQPPRKRSLYISIAEPLAHQNIEATVKGKTTYEQQVAAVRGIASLRSNGGPEVPLGSNSVIFGSQRSD